MTSTNNDYQIREPKNGRSLSDEQCLDLFRHIVQKKEWEKDSVKTRREAFMGKIIGRDKALDAQAGTPEAADGDTPTRKRLAVIDGAEKWLKVNDPKGETREVSWDVLASHACGEKLIDDVIAMFSEILPTQTDIFRWCLQCNINLYRSSDTMELHRDDCTNGSVPTTDTFQPAAITCLLFDESIKGFQDKAGFALYGDPTSNGAPYINKRRGPKFLRDERSEAGLLIGINGDAYRLGVHAAQVGWRGASDQTPFERMSLNFRLVRPRVWEWLREEANLSYDAAVTIT